MGFGCGFSRVELDKAVSPRPGRGVGRGMRVDSREIRRMLQNDLTGRGEPTVRLQRVDPYTDKVELERDCGHARNGRLSISNGRIVVVSVAFGIWDVTILIKSFLPL